MEREGKMSFWEWKQKRWYVFLISSVLGIGAAAVVGLLFFYPLVRYAWIPAVLLGYGASYIMYKAEYPGEE